MAKIVLPTPSNLRRLANFLARGGLVAVPTETVYGLAANALDPRACADIFRVKGRPLVDPLIVHVATPAHVEPLAEIPRAARQLMDAFWPGPLTLVLRKRPCVPAVVTAGLDTVAVRCPAHPVTRRLLRLCGCPLAAPSANPFGYISPTCATHVQAGLGRHLRYILDGGPCRVGLESTIVDLTDPTRPRILRLGGLAVSAIRRVLHRKVVLGHRAGDTGGPQRAPGRLTRHYSPQTPLRLHRSLSEAAVRRSRVGTGFLFFATPRFRVGESRALIAVLSPRGNPAEAARNLFARLQALDAAGLRVIHAELAPARGAGAAINDRLRRAAARRIA